MAYHVTISYRVPHGHDVLDLDLETPPAVTALVESSLRDADADVIRIEVTP